jgi:hypothetical protein
MRSITMLVKMAFPEPAGQKPSQKSVCRVAESREVKDTWPRRVIELADGKSVEEIAEALYLEELRAGAWQADIGLWKSAFYREVAQTIGTLAGQGYVCMELPPNGRRLRIYRSGRG